MGTGGGKFDVSDRITADRLNRKTIVADTCDNIATLTPTAGQLAFCIATGSGFTAGILYRRNAVNNAWEQVIDNASTQQLDNKTLASPTLSGTVTGAPTLSGNFVTSGTPKFDNVLDVKTISMPADPSSSYARIYSVTLDANNDRVFIKIKQANAFRAIPIINSVGDRLFHNNDTLRSSTNASYTKVKESTIDYTGAIRIKYDYQASGSGSVTYFAQLYINGVAVGTERSLNLGSGTSSDDVFVSSGDLVQVYVKVSSQVGGPNSTQISNFRFYVASILSAIATGGF